MKTQTIKLFFVALLSVSFLSGCLKDNDDINNIPRSVLTLVNAYSPAPYITQMADNNYLTTGYNPLEYNTYSAIPQSLFTGNRKIKTLSPNNQILIDTVYTFRDSTYYTSFVYGTAELPKQIISEDKSVEQLNDKSALRFFHLANNTGKVNVYLNTKETAIYSAREIEDALIGENLEHAKFVAQANGKTNIIITDAENNTLIERTVDLAAGRYYSIILTGDINSIEKPLYLGVVAQY